MLTRSAEETRHLGSRLAPLLSPGDVIILRGDLGAGKSELARGIARGLGIQGPVPSPSFTILNAYDTGRVPFYHFDWYRIREPEEIAEMGLEEQINGDGISVVEWSEKAPEFLPERLLEASIRVIDENTREIALTPKGGFPFGEEALL